MSIKLIIGLRNPGPNYTSTRHNAGEWFIEALAAKHSMLFNMNKSFHGEVAQFIMNQHTYKALLPLTFMNLSGQPTRAIAQFYRYTPDEILVIHDELDLPPGTIKFKTGGGHGGHNGLKDIISHLGTQAFHRLRIGIGHPGHKELVVNYVLGKPSPEDKQNIQKAIQHGVEVLPLILSGDIPTAMNQLHSLK